VSIERQFRKANRLLKGTLFEGSFRPPATEKDLDELQIATGVTVSGGLRELWLLANGSEYRNYGTPTFCAFTEGFIPCGFHSISEAVKTWSDPDVEEDFESVVETPARDRRIKPGWVNPRWIPFGYFDAGTTRLYYDADPAPQGSIGQIIAYQHDPERMHYIAHNFSGFFWRSNLFLQWLPPMRSWRRGDDA
jgi:cell wall assembly regulator SMI1